MKRTIGRIVYKPGSFFYATKRRRWFYKRLARIVYPTQKVRDYPSVWLRQLGYQVFQDWPLGNVLAWCDHRAKQEKTSRKPYLIDLFEDWDKAYLEPFTRSQQLTQYVESYLGEKSWLRAVRLYHSKPCPLPYTGSQLWHKDHDDTKQIKVFVAISNITKDNGPLEIYPKNAVRIPGYRWGGEAGHLSDDEFNKHTTQPFMMTATPYRWIANRGDVLLADTAQCFHRGARVESGERLMMMVHFTTRTPFI
jgi:hypothetical protein